MKGGNQVAVIGSNFINGAKVFINGVEGATTFTKTSKLDVIVPESTIDGLVSVKVVNPDGTEVEKADAYTYLAPTKAPAPEIDYLSETTAVTGEQKLVFIFGKNFMQNSKVYIGDEVVAVTYVSSNKVRINAPVSTEIKTVDVKLENPDGQFDVLAGGFSYIAPPKGPAPEIDYLSETTALTGEQKTIVLFGKNIAQGAKVFLDNEEIVMQFVTNSRVRIIIPASAQAKTVDVKLVNPDDQSAVLVGGFSYMERVPDPAPTITSLSSNSGTIVGNDSITITGTGFKVGAKVFLGNISASIVSITDTEIKIKTPPSSIVGLVSVKVVNPDQQEFILNDGFTYKPLPITITSLSITSGPVKGGNIVTILGTNFNNAMTVTVDGQQVNYTFLSATRIRITMPAATAAGTVDITVDSAGSKLQPNILTTNKVYCLKKFYRW